MIVSKTPVRISFFGGGTDYPDYFNEFGGSVLSTTIDKYVYITSNPIGGLLDDTFRIAYRNLEHCHTIDEIQHPSVRETLRFLAITNGLDINITSDLPARTGLGSSSSFTVGLLQNLYSYLGKEKTKQQLAEEAIHIEKNILKENVGVQDQLAAAFGGMNQMMFSSTKLEVIPLTIAQERQKELEDNLLLFYTGVNRFATEVLKEQVQKTQEKIIIVELKDIYNMVQEGISILQSQNTLNDFGKLLHQAWETKRKLSSSISSNDLDTIYNIATQAGATGGKLLGAGGGGFFLFYVEKEKQPLVRKALAHLHEINFKFENKGTQIIHCS